VGSNPTPSAIIFSVLPLTNPKRDRFGFGLCPLSFAMSSAVKLYDAQPTKQGHASQLVAGVLRSGRVLMAVRRLCCFAVCGRNAVPGANQVGRAAFDL
jgi:hypothetical protein